MEKKPDLFTNVHKGIRAALFEAALLLGRADAHEEGHARLTLSNALDFVETHGKNEDLSLLPALETRAPDVAAKMRKAHAAIDVFVARLRAELETSDSKSLYLEFSRFIAIYLTHMAEEELELETPIRSVIGPEEIVEGGRAAIARTSPSARETMLGFVVSAIPAPDARTLLERVPEPLATTLRERRFPSSENAATRRP